MKRLFAFVAVLALVLSACTETKVMPDSNLRSIRVAYTPEKAALFEELVSKYNKQASVKIEAVKLEWPDMLDEVAAGKFIAVSPDSSIWLETLDSAWLDGHPGSSSVVGTTTRYASSPVLIATWAGKESDLGKEDQRGWQSLMNKAKADPNYRWSHGSPKASASGLLALTAEFYTGAGKTFGLSKADADSEQVRKYVGDMEKTIARYGGESDAALVDYLLGDGQNVISAVVMPEASIVDFNRRTKSKRLGGISPVEGTLMLDHPLVLLETPELTPNQRKAYLDFARYLRSDEGQNSVIAYGYRPIDISVDLAKTNSPLKAENGVLAAQPILLQIPPAGTLNYLKQSWATGLKRRANIMLVVDVSGSMQENDKLTKTKEALRSFLKQIPSDQERVGLASFSDDYKELVPLGTLASNRTALENAIDALTPGGNTAFYYATWKAYGTVFAKKDPERINVVIAMTDGLENRSPDKEGRNGVPTLTVRNSTDPVNLLKAMKGTGSGVLVFTVGYGSDADMGVLTKIASGFDGQAYRADTNTIRKLYELISQNF